MQVGDWLIQLVVQIMALSKFEEWLQNKNNSFLKYRINAALRTVHRRHIAFQVHHSTNARSLVLNDFKG